MQGPKPWHSLTPKSLLSLRCCFPALSVFLWFSLISLTLQNIPSYEYFLLQVGLRNVKTDSVKEKKTLRSSTCIWFWRERGFVRRGIHDSYHQGTICKGQGTELPAMICTALLLKHTLVSPFLCSLLDANNNKTKRQLILVLFGLVFSF